MLARALDVGDFFGVFGFAQLHHDFGCGHEFEVCFGERVRVGEVEVVFFDVDLFRVVELCEQFWEFVRLVG